MSRSASRSSHPCAPAAYASATTRSRSARLRPRTLISRCAFAASLCLTLPLTGCYLAHVATGQTRVLAARERIDVVLADPATEDELRDRLVRVSQVRDFASELGLRVGKRYTHYAPWPGDRVVTTVVA